MFWLTENMVGLQACAGCWSSEIPHSACAVSAPLLFCYLCTHMHCSSRASQAGVIGSMIPHAVSEIAGLCWLLVFRALALPAQRLHHLLLCHLHAWMHLPQKGPLSIEPGIAHLFAIDDGNMVGSQACTGCGFSRSPQSAWAACAPPPPLSLY